MIQLLPLFAGLIVTTLLTAKIRVFQGVFFLLGSSLLALTYFGYVDSSLIVVASTLVVAEIVHFVLIGTGVAEKIGLRNVMSLMYGVGLFPFWVEMSFAGVPLALPYVLLSSALIATLTGIAKARGSREPFRPGEKIQPFRPSHRVQYSIGILIASVAVATIFV